MTLIRELMALKEVKADKQATRDKIEKLTQDLADLPDASSDARAHEEYTHTRKKIKADIAELRAQLKEANITLRTLLTEDHALVHDTPTVVKYSQLLRQMNQLMQDLSVKIQHHEQKFNTSGGTNWGFVGDLENGVETLKDLTSFFQ